MTMTLVEQIEEMRIRMHEEFAASSTSSMPWGWP